MVGLVSSQLMVATRTGILQITGLNVSDAADYTCEVRRRRGGGSVTRTQTLSLPGNSINNNTQLILGMMFL
jgi:hypothetical protein